MQERKKRIMHFFDLHRKEFCDSFIIWLILSIITVYAVIFVYHIWDRDIKVPIVFDGDGLGAAMTIRNLIDGNGIFQYPRLSAPYAENIYLQDNILQLFIVKIIILFSKDVGIVTNIYWLLTYLFTSYSMYWASRKLGIGKVEAVACALIYNFLPYHYFRTSHFWLFGCYLIPLAAWVIISLAESSKEEFTKRDFLYYIIISFLFGISSIYYSLFFLILILTAVLYNFFRKKEIIVLKNFGVILFTNVFGIFLVDILPCIVNSSSTIGETAVQREFGNVYAYSLNFFNLFLPIPGHRIKVLSDLTKDIFVKLGTNTEGYMVMLGLFMSIGCIISIISVLFGKKDSRVRLLGMLIIVSVLVSIIGGLDLFIGYFVSSSIRCYNRFSVFIAVFSCICLGIIMKEMVKRNRRIAYIVIVFVTFIAIEDQTSSSFANYASYNIETKEYVYNYEETENLYYVISDFVDKIESDFEENTMVFQLPITSSYNGGTELEYQQMQSYVCSKSIKWSSNAVTIGRQYNMLKKMENLSYNQLVSAMAIEGFRGVLVDKTEYSDEEFEKLNKFLFDLSKGDCIESENGWLIYYNISDYCEELIKKYSEDDINEVKEYLETNSKINMINFGDLHFTDQMSRNADENGMICIEKGVLQFGPYINLPAGEYQVVINGSGLENAEIYCTSNAGAKTEKTEILSQTNENIIYRVIVDEDVSGVEFILKNDIADMKIDTYLYCDYDNNNKADYNKLMKGYEKLSEFN